MLATQGVFDFEPTRRDRRARLAALRTPEGEALPPRLSAEILRQVDRLELAMQQLAAVEAERDAALAAERATGSAARAAATPHSGQDDAAATKRFQEKFGGHMTTLLDPNEGGYPVSNAFGITHVPTLFLVETDGVISKVISGFVKADLEAIAARAGVPIFRADEAVPMWKAG